MKIKGFIEKMNNKEELSDKEIDNLVEELYLKPSIFRVVIKGLCVILAFLPFIITFVLANNMVLDFILLALGLVLSLFVLVFNKKKKNILLYLDSMKKVYKDKLSSYEGFNCLFLKQRVEANSYLENNCCIFLTDGYDFYIYDDFFTETSYLLPEKYTTNLQVLKVLNSKYLNKEPLYFKLSDIISYKIITSGSQKELCLIELSDNKSLELEKSVISLLQERVPAKEIK